MVVLQPQNVRQEHKGIQADVICACITHAWIEQHTIDYVDKTLGDQYIVTYIYLITFAHARPAEVLWSHVLSEQLHAPGRGPEHARRQRAAA